MKKIISLLLIGAMIFAFASCGKKDEEQTVSEDIVKNEETTDDIKDVNDNENSENEDIGDDESKEEETDNAQPVESAKPAGGSNSSSSAHAKPNNSSSSGQNASKPENKPQTAPHANTPASTPEATKPSQTPTPAPVVNKTTDDLIKDMNVIAKEASESFMMVDNIPLDETNFSYYTFVDYVEGAVAVANESMIGAQAHSIVLVWLPDKSKVASVAANIEKNMNPRKWICVEAEKSFVRTKGNYILLVMTKGDLANKIEANFNSLAV